MSVTPIRILKYVTLPEILPRIRDIFSTGFGFIAFCVACIFGNMGLLPANHPYVFADNIGKYSIFDVLAQSAQNLRFRLIYLDRILVFGMVLLGIVLILMQIGLLGFAFFVQTAQATTPLPTSFAGFFVSPDPVNDISYMLMDRIFGIPDLFGSCVSRGEACLLLDNPNAIPDGVFPMPYHIALQAMLGFYSQGLLFLAALIIGYYVVTILSETSQSGTPFGKRFNHIWAPVRLVIALGLLIPVAHNLNAAQYITLYIAKFGSAFATNGWNFYINGLNMADDASAEDTLGGHRDTMIAKPQYPSASEMVQFMGIAHTCKTAYKKMYDIDIDAYLVRQTQGGPPPAGAVPDASDESATAISMQDYLTTASNDAPYYNLQEWFGLGDVVIVFGEQAPEHEQFKGNVRPYCGSVVSPSARFIKPEGTGLFHDGVDYLAYVYIIYTIYLPWQWGYMGAEGSGGTGAADMSFIEFAEHVTNNTLPQQRSSDDPIPDKDVLLQALGAYDEMVRLIVDDALMQMRERSDWRIHAMAYGWAGAGTWYNKIAELNGSFTESVLNVPYVTRYPEIMEWVKEEKAKNNVFVPGESLYEPHQGSGQSVMEGRDQRDFPVMAALYKTYSMWNEVTQDTTTGSGANSFIDAIKPLFDNLGLWSLRDNEHVHPLASMTSLGRSLLTKSIIAFGAGTATGISGAMGIVAKGSLPQQILSNLSSFMITVAYVGLTAGILLYYVVPFLPFVYFVFAVLGWAKTIFEAMVGVPLWALAHLRYDGDGFPSQQSLYGYYLLLDIFLRPILIVFGLIASVSIFYALAKTLNNVFDLVTANLTGFDMRTATSKDSPPRGVVGHLEQFRGPIDQLFFTIIYAMIIYMIGMSCFKLIDQFPNSILRWMGSTATGMGSLNKEDGGQVLSTSMQHGTYRASDATRSMTQEITGYQHGPSESG